MNSEADIQAALAEMIRMQRAHNIKVHPEWDRQGYAFFRAVWVECAELLDHFGWKWWKRQDADIEQVRLEVVDIWHFILSDCMAGGESELELAASFVDLESKTEHDPMDFRLSVERLAALSLARERVVDAFVDVLAALPMTFEELFGIYRGKNVLNRFRQDHGYKEGTYVKNWKGKEDNVHLVQVLRTVPAESEDFEERLYNRLTAVYCGITEGN